MIVASLVLASSSALSVPKPRVAIFSETAGFRHDCIETGQGVIGELAKIAGWSTTIIKDEDFTDAGLAKTDVVVFMCTTGDVLNDAQQAAFERFIASGGGYVGIHSASDTEYGWPWYAKFVGAQFRSHPAIQPADIRIEQRGHPATAFLPNPWRRTDEWYDFRANPRPGVNVLANLDPKTYQNHVMGDDHPIIWYQDGLPGRMFYTGLGHTKETYGEPLFRRHLEEAILWSAQGQPAKGAKPVEWKDLKGWTNLFNNGNAPHLVSKQSYGDQYVHAEFQLPKGSNSGVYVQGRYEIQIFDSYGKADSELTFADAGGVYQRYDEKTQKGWEGVPAKVNALRPPGVWNTYDILFRAPRFANGKKVSDAMFEEVRVNGVVVQTNVRVTGPTRAPMFADEAATGPLMLQGDHGPVTFRNVWVAPHP